MAVINGSAATEAIDLLDTTSIDFVNQDPAGPNSSTNYSWLTSGSDDIRAIGTGITFDGMGLATGGTITEFEIDLSNDNLPADVQVTGLNASLVSLTASPLNVLTALLDGDTDITGSAFGDNLLGDKGAGGADTIDGAGGNDTIDGGDGNDELTGGDGSDSVFGGGGNDFISEGSDVFVDTLSGGLGDDTITVGSTIGGDSFDGGDGIDFIDWSGSAQSGGTFDLGAGTAGAESMTNFENFKGTGGADSVLGSSVANELHGSAGNDTLFGNGGDDTLMGGDGADSINGGDGIDVASYAGAFAGIRVALWDPNLNNGDAAGDIIQFTTEIIEGSGFNDNIQGNASNNTLQGGFGDDLILGGFGDDVLEGGAGADDTGGGAGRDRVTYINSTGAVTVVLSNPAANAGDAIGDNIRPDVEVIEGSNFNDSLQGNTSNNELWGGVGGDTLVGGLGNDTLKGGGGADSIVGGDGFDIASYDSAFGVRVALWNPALNEGDAVGDTINFQVEAVLGSRFSDNIQGNASNNVLRGNLGDDLILGGFGNDTLEGGAGADDMGGGADVDTVTYANASAGITLVLSNTALNTGDAVGDNIRPDVEIIEGSAFADFLQGNASNNNLWGAAGDDTLIGAFGNDTLFGFSGQDSIVGGDGNDSLDGYSGNDTLTGNTGADTFLKFIGEGNDVITDFAAGAAVNDVIRLNSYGSAFDSFAEVLAAAAQVGADTVITFGVGDTLTLSNVLVGNLNANDFTFA